MLLVNGCVSTMENNLKYSVESCILKEYQQKNYILIMSIGNNINIADRIFFFEESSS